MTQEKPISDLIVSAKSAFDCYQGGQQECILEMWPAQELFQCVAEPNPVEWLKKWETSGGKIFSGRMIALKSDPVWIHISQFGLPYPPFDKYDLMWVRDIDRVEAEQLGIISSRQKTLLQNRNWSRDKNRIH